MEDELLADILAAESEIRLQSVALEQQTAERLETVRQELDRLAEHEALSLQVELDKALSSAGQKADLEAEALLAEVRTYALRLESLESVALDRTVANVLSRICPEGRDDHQDE